MGFIFKNLVFLRPSYGLLFLYIDNTYIKKYSMSSQGINVDIRNFVLEHLDKLKESESYYPVLEGIVNSIQSIERKYNGDVSKGKITINIRRDTVQKKIADTPIDIYPISGFEISDNGDGFTEDNLTSFKTVCSGLKKEIGCKGVGRFYWLKVFSDVHIESKFLEDDNIFKASFDFNIDDVCTNYTKTLSNDDDVGTTIYMHNFHTSKDETRLKTAKSIAYNILEHCLIYYVYEKVPEIILVDTDDEKHRCKLNLNDLFLKIKSNIVRDSEDLILSDEKFSFTYVKLYYTSKKSNRLYLCADYRVVENKALDIFSNDKLSDINGQYCYSIYVSSPYFDKHVNESRTQFTIPKTPRRTLDETDYSLSMEEILTAVETKLKDYFKEDLIKVEDKKRSRLEEFVKNDIYSRNSTLKYYHDEIIAEMKPNSSDEEIGALVDKCNRKFEKTLFDSSKKIVSSKSENLLLDEEKYIENIEKLDAIQKDNLNKYILHRKFILDYINSKMGIDEHGKTNYEKVIHNAIFPKKTTSLQLDDEFLNLWVIDDRLTSYSFASSDLNLDYEDGTHSEGRPDILIYSDCDNDDVAKSIIIIEFKRPELNSKESIVDQIYKYIDEIKANKIRFANKHKIIINNSTQYYCYGICDLEDNVRKDLEENRNFVVLPDGLGYFNYNSKRNAHINIFGYKTLINDAEKRNKILFKKLGIPLDRYK